MAATRGGCCCCLSSPTGLYAVEALEQTTAATASDEGVPPLFGVWLKRQLCL